MENHHFQTLSLPEGTFLHFSAHLPRQLHLMRNDLTLLPESLGELQQLERLDAMVAAVQKHRFVSGTFRGE
jgi:hypothetical protein